jgi:hypothetical protein
MHVRTPVRRVHRVSSRLVVTRVSARLESAEKRGRHNETGRAKIGWQPVAVLVSLREFERLRGKRLHFGDAYKKFLETHSLREIGVDDDFAVSTRDRTTGRKMSL